MSLITCESHDFIVVWDTNQGLNCPVCEMEGHVKDLESATINHGEDSVIDK